MSFNYIYTSPFQFARLPFLHVASGCDDQGKPLKARGIIAIWG